MKKVAPSVVCGNCSRLSLFHTLLFLFSTISLHVYSQTNVSGEVSGIWTRANSPYVLQGYVGVAVGQTLTIQPGVEVRSLSYSDRLVVYGTLLAKGTATDSIYFKGFPDGSNPSSSHGGYIQFMLGSNSSVLDYVSMDRWGDNSQAPGTLYMNNASPTITRSTIRNSEAPAIYMDGSSTPTVNNNRFSPAETAVYAPIEGLTNVASNAQAVIKIRNSSLVGNATLSRQSTGSYYLLEGGFTIDQTSALDIKPGVEIRSMSYTDRIIVYGTLKAKGTVTDSIRFIGLPNPSNPSSTLGGYIQFSTTSTGCELEYIAMDRWGDNSYAPGALYLNNASPTIRNSQFRHGTAPAIYADGQSSPTITGNRFAADAIALYAQADNFTNVTNNQNAVIRIRNSSVYGNAAIPRQGSNSYYVLESGFTIDQTGTLEIKPGVEIRSYRLDDRIIVYGSLKAKGTVADSIRLIGFPNPSNPSSTHGGYIQFSSGADASELDYVSIDRWGDKNYAPGAVYINGGVVTITHCDVRNSDVSAFYIDNGQPAITGNTFTRPETQVYANIDNLRNVTNNSNTAIRIRSSSVYGHSVLPRQAAGSYYLLEGGFSIEQPGTLEIQPGVEIRSARTDDRIMVNGTLLAQGTASEPITLKGFAHPTNPNASHGGYLYFLSSSRNSLLEYVNIDRWGDASYSGFAIYNSSPHLRINHCSISNSETYGIYNSADSLYITETDIFNNVTGLYNTQGKAFLTNSKIYNNSGYGINNAGPDTVDARNCYWGAPQGPHHPVTNPAGTGNQVSDRVLFTPWIQQQVKVEQTINMPLIAPQYVGDTLHLTATASSGLPVSYQLVTVPAAGVARLSGDTLFFSGGTGQVTLTVTQAGNTFFNPAPVIERTFSVTKRNQTIQFAAIGSKKVNDTPFVVLATASSGLPVSFRIVSGPATIKTDTLTLTGAGTVTIEASQPGDTYYIAANPVRQSFTVRPLLPDLAIKQVGTNKTQLSPGDSVTVSWQVANEGEAAALHRWTESIYIQSPSGENLTYIGQVVLSGTDSLPTGAQLSRSTTVRLPEQLYIGDQGVFVVVFAPTAPLEEMPGATANNTGVQATAWNIVRTLTLTLSANQLTEGAANGITAYVYRSGSLAQALTVQNSVTHSSRLTIPATLTIPAGQAGASFLLTAPDNTIFDGNAADTLRISAAGFTGAKAGFTLLDDDKATLSIHNLPATATEGDTVRFSVHTNLAPAAPLEVFLTSSQLTRFPLPASVIIPTGQTSANVSVPLAQDSLPETTVKVGIAAGAANHHPVSDTLTLEDDDVPQLQLVIQTGIVTESAGPYATQATLRRLTPGSTQAFTAHLSASLSNTLLLPGSVTLAAGESEKTFHIGVVDNDLADGERTVTINASLFIASCNCTTPPASSGSVSVILKVSDNDGPSLQVTASKQTLPEGQTTAGMLRISRNTATAQALTVTLTSSNTQEATVPAQVVIPAGQSFAEVSITTLNDGVNDGSQQVYFQASATGFATGATWILVTDRNKPDLQIASVALLSNNVQPDSLLQYTVTLRNTGFATAPSGIRLRGYLSKDATIDSSDLLIAQDLTPEAIPSEASRQVINAVAVPVAAVGDYQLLFVVNHDTAYSELLFTNNTAAPYAITIAPPYTATAQTAAAYYVKGVPIPVTGTATLANGSPAAQVPVEIYVLINGLRRTLTATTTNNGQFTATFTPLAGEAGHYSLGASFPGLQATAGQDAFDIVGVRVNEGKAPDFLVPAGDTLRGILKVQNLSNQALTGFSLVPVQLPGGAVMRFDTLPLLAGNATMEIAYRVSGNTVSPGDHYEPATLHAKSDEGILQPVPAYYYCQAAGGHLVADVSAIRTTVSQSKGERLIEFRLINKGRVASGPVTVNLPKVDWIARVTANPLPSLTPGDTALVVLKLKATPEVPFDYPVNTGIGISSEQGNHFNIPLSFEKVSESNGAARITVTNQFTYYTEGAPKVSQARVQIKNYFTGALYGEGYTNAAGIYVLGNIPEGKHRIVIAKEKHLPYEGTITINPGDTTKADIFINYQAITFSWQVTPTAVQDQYDINLVTTFETNVPMPVVTITMPDSVPRLGDGEVFSFNATLTNHGLITAKDVTITLPEGHEYEFITNYIPADLPAKQSIQVPILMRRRADQPGKINAPLTMRSINDFLGMKTAQGSAGDQALPCKLWTKVIYWYYCDIYTGMWQQGGWLMTIKNLCNGPGNGGGTSGGGGGGATGGGAQSQPTVGGSGPHNPRPAAPACTNCTIPAPDCLYCEVPSLPGYITDKKGCVQCVNDMAAGVLGYLGFDKSATTLCLNGQRLENADLEKYIQCVLETALSSSKVSKKVLKKKAKLIGRLLGIKDMILAIPKCFKIIQVNSRTGSRNTAGSPMQEIYDNLQKLDTAYGIQTGWLTEYFGELTEIDAWEEFSALIVPYMDSLSIIPVQEQGNIMNTLSGYDIQSTTLEAFFDRWNTSIQARNQQILSPNVQYPHIIDWNKVKSWSDSLAAIHNYAIDKGFQSIEDLHDRTMQSFKEIVISEQNAVCASVTVQFSQQLTMTREAFKGTLEIFNGHPTDKMDSLSVNIRIVDENGVPANGLFEIQTTSLTNLSDVTGTGKIDAQQKGGVQFLFIPEQGAAPQTPKEYRFGGSIRYWDPYAKAMVTMPLNAVPITVNPSPHLMLHYFMQRNILGDDALTSAEVEPSIPAELSVMVENQGYGPAVNMVISSAQPKVIDNEKGLAINFELTGSQFQGQAKQLGVTDINFGTIPGQQARTGQWYFTSSLLGKFVSYEANVVHANSFGNPELSLVKGIQLHELSKSIREYGSLADNIPDFLVNDVFDIDDRPDIIYFSQGQRTAKVHQATAGSFSSPVQAPAFTNTLTVTPAETGYNYIRLPDPGNRLYELAGITRSDGQVIPLDNAWLTFVTLPVARPPVYENKFHFVDYFAAKTAVTYTVTWKPKSRSIPKVDSIHPAPPAVTSLAVQKLKVAFNKRIDASTFTKDDLTLTFQGGANLINNSVVITQVDTATYEVDLSALTTGNGSYQFTVQAAEVSDLYGTKGESGKQISWSQFLTTPAVEAFTGLPDNRVAPVYRTMQVLFNIPVDITTVTPQRFTIMKDGVLQSGSVVIDSIRADHRLFYLSGLQHLLTQSGQYELTVDLPGIRSTSNEYGLQTQSIVLTVDNAGPRIVLLEKSTTGGINLQHIPHVQIEFDEEVVGFNTASVQLTRNGDLIHLPIDRLSNTDLKHWLAGDFGMLTYPDGNYIFSINLAGIRDKAGNSGTGTQQVTWTVNSAAQVTITQLSVTPDGGHSNSDGVTAGLTLTVHLQLDAAASQLTLSQVDASGEAVLATLTNVPAGAVTIPVTLPVGGNIRLKATASGTNGIASSVERSLVIDQLPLSAQWQFATGQTLPQQTDSLLLQFSARPLDPATVKQALKLQHNGTTLSTAALGVQAVNDSLYRLTGLDDTYPQPGQYQLTGDLTQLRKYSSGKAGEGTLVLSWIVAPVNRAPIARAGNDTMITATGVVVLSGAASSDPDGDAITYQWTAPTGIVLNNPQSASPSFTVTAAHQNDTLSFLLVVSDGKLFTTDVVKVFVHLPPRFSLPANNFTVMITGESCRPANDGSISITAKENLNYTVQLTSATGNSSYTFTQSKTIGNLPAGNYTACITVAGHPDYQQCYDLVITEPKDLAVYVIVNNQLRQVNLSMRGGTVYTIEVNGRVYTTTDSTLTLPLTEDISSLKVSTEKACQGIFETQLSLTRDLLYPNPFERTLYIKLKEGTGPFVETDLYTSTGKKVFTRQYRNTHGILQLDLPGLPHGVYLLHLKSDGPASVYKIIKQ